MKKFRALSRTWYFWLALLISLLLGILTYIGEELAFRKNIATQIIGLNEAWQSNSSNYSGIRSKGRSDEIQYGLANLETFIGNDRNANLKLWFSGFLDKVMPTDTNTRFNRNLLFYLKDSLLKKSSAKWSIRKDIAYSNSDVNYRGGQVLLKKADSLTRIEEQVFSEFVDYILNDKLIGLNDQSKISSEGEKEFNRYNHIVFQSIWGDSLKRYTLLNQNMRVNRFFIACLKDSSENMVVWPAYPYVNFVFNPDERPWWKAALDNDQFPSGFVLSVVDDNNVKFGLTGLYNDIQAQANIDLAVRTYYCTFKVPSSPDATFVACLDLFMENEGLERNISEFSGNEPLGFFTSASTFFMLHLFGPISYGMGFLLDALLVFLIFMALFLLLQFRVVSFLTLIRNQLYPAKTHAFNLEFVRAFSIDTGKPTFSVRWINEEIASTARSFSRTFNVKIASALNGIFQGAFGMESTESQSDSGKESDTFEMTYNPMESALGIDKSNYYRCIELWKMVDEKGKDAYGLFIVKWLNNVFTQEELAIEVIGPLARYDRKNKGNKIITKIKRELASHLLRTDTKDDFRIIINMEEEQQDKDTVEMPQLLRDKTIQGVSLEDYFFSRGQGNRIFERKLFFKYRKQDDEEFLLFLALYSQAEISAICGVSFLSSMMEGNGKAADKQRRREKLREFARQTLDAERIFIERSENELGNFCRQYHDDEIIRLLHDNKRFKVWKYDEKEKEEIYDKERVMSFYDLRQIYKSYDFGLAKKFDLTLYVFYYLGNSTDKELAWLSWRDVDIKFYDHVFNKIKADLEQKIVPISVYLEEAGLIRSS